MVVLAFDVNETLLSLRPMRDRFHADFAGDVEPGEWFARMLHGSILANVLDQYRPFDEIGVETLVSLARRSGRVVTMDQARAVVGLMAEAPPHPDVLSAIGRLASQGRRMIALTNGSTEVANAQMHNAGLDSLLEKVISCDQVGRFKPDPSVYQHAAEKMTVTIGDLTVVASHDWDCAGAVAAGASAVFVARPGAQWSLPGNPPSQVGDLTELAQLLGS